MPIFIVVFAMGATEKCMYENVDCLSTLSPREGQGSGYHLAPDFTGFSAALQPLEV
ncbi:MAG TPA: hypothetical protein VEA59_07415 [Patescibacteria group bacterium]|nr:hypothetical protein [Patescibacteria group bacterium]